MALAAKQNGQHPMDDVSEAVSRAVGGVEQIKGERDRFRDHAVKSDNMVAVRDGEIAAMTRENSNLRYRLTFYQNYAARLSSSFNNILAIMDEALSAASEAAQQQADIEQTHGSAELPAIEIPLFMQKMREEAGLS